MYVALIIAVLILALVFYTRSWNDFEEQPIGKKFIKQEIRPDFETNRMARMEEEYIERMSEQRNKWNYLAAPFRPKIQEFNPPPTYNRENLRECMDYIIKVSDLLEKLKQTDFPDWLNRLGMSLNKLSEESITQLETTNNIRLPEDFKKFVTEIGFYTNELRFDQDDYGAIDDTYDKVFFSPHGFLVTSEHGCGIEAGISLNPEYFGEYWVNQSGDDGKLADNVIAFELRSAQEQLNSWLKEDSK